MFFSRALQVVFNTKGGRKWNKPWGLPRLSRYQRRNRRIDIKIFNSNLSILKRAAACQPEVPVRLHTPLPDWQLKRLKRFLNKAQQMMNWQASLLPPAAQQAVKQQQLSAVRPRPYQ